MTTTDTRPDTGWQKRAACVGADPELFFASRNGGPAGTIYPDQAVACCRRCTVRDACLAYALADPSITGYWGGTGDDTRKQLRREAAREATA